MTSKISLNKLLLATGLFATTLFTTAQAGTYEYRMPVQGITPITACTSPWGTAVANGNSITAYKDASVAYGADCQAETRTCTRGALTGTYQNESCITVPDNGILLNGAGYVRLNKALPNSNNFTVEAWVTVSEGGGTLWCDADGAVGNDTFVGINPTMVVARGDKSGSSGATGGSWQGGINWNHGQSLGSAVHHVIFSAGTGSFKVFIDGVQVVSGTNTLTNNNNHGAVIGKWSDSSGGNTAYPFSGKITEMRYYARALSATEASAAFTAGRARPLDAGTVAAWNFQEGSGTTVNDYSGNGYSGTLMGTASWVVIN